MSEFRKEPGEHLIDVRREGQSLLLTKAGKPIAKVVPVDETTTIESDGTIRGERPLTMRLKLASSY